MIRCAIRENEAMILHIFCKGLNDDLKKKKDQAHRCFPLDQVYTIVQDYELLIKSRWTKHQAPLRIPFRSQFRNNDFLLGASPYRPNPSSAKIYKEDKGK
jgi:hypothetical protein